jgi:hypothetical protein
MALQLATLKINHFVTAATFYLLPLLIWQCIKPIITKNVQLTRSHKKMMAIKYNSIVFNSLLQQQNPIQNNGLQDVGIIINQPNAINTLVKVCNPFCGPCATAHNQLEKLLQLNNTCNLQILFTATTNPEDERRKPVLHFLAIQQYHSKVVLLQSLDYWYNMPTKNYEQFAIKYPLSNTQLQEQEPKIAAMEQWCRQSNIQFTPTLYINGYQLPKEYNLKDVQYIL